MTPDKEYKPPVNPDSSQSATVFQQDIFPGQVKAIHLQPNPVETGMLYYCQDGRLVGIRIGSSGQFLTIAKGVPTWSSTLPNYASNALALAAGLTAGMFYRNGDNVCITH